MTKQKHLLKIYYEMCPYCGREVELFSMVDTCSNCGKLIVCCSNCPFDTCSTNCPYEKEANDANRNSK